MFIRERLQTFSTLDEAEAYIAGYCAATTYTVDEYTIEVVVDKHDDSYSEYDVYCTINTGG